MPDPAAIDEAADRLARAKRPLILVGGGAVGTRKPLTDIAQRIGAPVLASNAGKGILPDSHPLSLGCSVLQEASKQALADADVVLLVGSEVAAGDHFLAKLEIAGDIIRIDIDPTELTSMYSAAVPIQADARAAMLGPVVRTVQPHVGGATAGRRALGPGDSRAQCRENDQPRTAARARLEDPASGAAGGRHRDGRRHADCVYRYLRHADGNGALLVLLRQLLRPRSGAADGHWCQDRRAASAGDRPSRATAEFMFTVSELATAAEERLALPVIVWNNDGLQAIVEGMDDQHIPRIGVEPRSPDFLRLAESLGLSRHPRRERRAPG